MTYPISDVTRRVIYSGSIGPGPYPFSFEILEEDDIAVYKNSTLLTITSDYTVTINANGTGEVNLTASAVASDSITIVGSKGIARSTDFVTGGDLFASSLNDEFDAQTIFAQQNAEAILRSVRANVTDPLSTNMELPPAATRAGYFLYFDPADGSASQSLGTPDMQALAPIVSEMQLLAADIAGGTLGSARLYDLGNITDSAGTLSASPNGYMVTIYNNLANVQAVGAGIANVNAVGSDLLGADNVGTVATDLAGADNIGTVAADIADVSTVAADIADVSAVATALTGVPSGASLVTYDNTTSGLTATDTQAAIDELESSSLSGGGTISGNITISGDLTVTGTFDSGSI